MQGAWKMWGRCNLEAWAGFSATRWRRGRGPRPRLPPARSWRNAGRNEEAIEVGRAKVGDAGELLPRVLRVTPCAPSFVGAC